MKIEYFSPRNPLAFEGFVKWFKTIQSQHTDQEIIENSNILDFEWMIKDIFPEFSSKSRRSWDNSLKSPILNISASPKDGAWFQWIGDGPRFVDELNKDDNFIAIIIPSEAAMAILSGCGTKRPAVLIDTQLLSSDGGCGTSLALFSPQEITSDSPSLWTENREIFLSENARKEIFFINERPAAQSRLDGPKNLYLQAHDDFSSDSIQFFRSEENGIIGTPVAHVDPHNIDQLVDKLNFIMKKWRIDAKSIFLKKSHGLRKDGKVRRKISKQQIEFIVNNNLT